MSFEEGGDLDTDTWGEPHVTTEAETGVTWPAWEAGRGSALRSQRKQADTLASDLWAPELGDVFLRFKALGSTPRHGRLPQCPDPFSRDSLPLCPPPRIGRSIPWQRR